MTTKSLPRYSVTYEDEQYQYRHVIVDRSLVGLIPKNRLMDECEWRALGIKQGAHWEHYLIHKPEPFVLMFRRSLKYRSEPDPSMESVNSHGLNARIPISANRKVLSSLTDSTNKPGVFRMSINKNYQEMNESGFESH